MLDERGHRATTTARSPEGPSRPRLWQLTRRALRALLREERAHQIEELRAARPGANVEVGDIEREHVFDDAGRASVAPIYDVLPMALAPRNDELPDVYLRPRAPTEDPIIKGWVDNLAQAMERDPSISVEFKLLWQNHVGR